jgi:hypothetical protein
VEGAPLRQSSINRSLVLSNRKVRKIKTEKLAGEQSFIEEISGKQDSKQAKDQDEEESDALSDSEPSEDNLDDD